MYANLFSSFDPENSTIYSMTLNLSSLMWIMTLMIPVFVMLNHKLAMNPWRTIMTMPMNVTYQMINRNQLLKNLGGSMPLLTSLFSLLLFINLSGLCPFTFSLTSHLSFNLALAFPLWLSIILMSFSYSTPLSLSHLTPSGAPTMLAPFLVIIETISVLIRPLTLALRLSANVTAGHVMMGMISIATVGAQTFTMFTAMTLLGVFYTCFEMTMMILQGYIFTMLPSLYAEEHPMQKK